MIKRILIAMGVVLVALVFRPAYQLGVGVGFWQPFTRPVGVPAEAHYVATLKSSAWFDCLVDDTRDLDICQAWDDAGHLVARGKYRLDGQNRAAKAVELRPSTLNVYPGHPELSWIYLGGDQGIFSKTLVPVNDSGQPLERFEVH